MALETRDINSGSGITIDGVDELNTNKFIQSVYVKTDGVDFSGQAGGTTPEQLFNQQSTTIVSAEFTCTGRATLVFKIEYSSPTVSATFRIWFKDHNGTPFWRPTMTITPSNVGASPSGITPAQAGFSHGVYFSIPTEGSKTIKVQLVSITNPGADKVSLWVDGI